MCKTAAKLLSVPILILTFLYLSAFPVSSQATTEDAYVANEIVVKLVNPADLTAVASQYGLDPVPINQFGSRAIYRLRILDGTLPPDKAEQLVSDPSGRILYAEPNFEAQTPEGRGRVLWASGEGGGEFTEQWAAAMIRLPEAHTITRGAGNKVAVLDTGVELSHPALAGRLVNGYDFVDLDSDPSEVGVYGQNAAYGHGTHVAGLVAVTAPDAQIMPLRVLDPDGVGNIWVLAEALLYAVDPDGNPNTNDGATVINLSLGTTRQTDLLEEIIGDLTCDDDDDDDDDDCLGAERRGIIVVASAGNRGGSIPEYPAAEGIAGLLSIAASTQADTLASFSNHGQWVSVAAPGEAIVSSVPGGGFGVWSGTSMAAPFAAGEAALLRAAYPDLSAAEIAARIVSTAATISGPVPRRIDVASALNATTGDTPCTGTLGAISIDGNVVVPSGASCTLIGTRVDGNVIVHSDASLTTRNARVGGNIFSDRAIAIDIRAGTDVIGSIQLKNGHTVEVNQAIVNGDLQLEENSGSLLVSLTRIGGDLQFFKNTGTVRVLSNPMIDGDLQVFENLRRATIDDNRVGANLQLYKNMGGLAVTNNVVSENLQCKDNAPPVVESGNVVGGEKDCSSKP